MKNYLFYLLAFSLLLLTSCSKEKSDWLDADKLNTVQVFEQFIKKYPQSALVDSAIAKIVQISYEEAAMKNTLSDYKDFIRRFPESSYVDSANNQILGIKLSVAKSSRDIEQVINIVDSNSNSQPVNDLLVNADDVIELNTRQTIMEEFTVIIKNTGDNQKLSIQVKIPPNQKFKMNPFFDNSMIIEGSVSSIMSIRNGEIVDVSHQESSNTGVILAKEAAKDVILPVSSKFLQMDQHVVVRISDSEILYSISDQTMFQRIDLTNTYRLTNGKAYKINLN